MSDFNRINFFKWALTAARGYHGRGRWNHEMILSTFASWSWFLFWWNCYIPVGMRWLKTSVSPIKWSEQNSVWVLFLVTKIGKGGERTVGGCCVVPSDWEGQTAGQAAAAALKWTSSLLTMEKSILLKLARAFFVLFRMVIFLFVCFYLV